MAKKIAVFNTTKGTFKIELFEDKAPKTVNNFISLTQKGFYNGLVFHRVIKDFMIQGGCPQGTGRGGPGYTIKDEFHPQLRHDAPGMLSMANAGPNTGGSPWLDNHHAVFGKVVEGLDVVMNISEEKTDRNDRPVDTVSIRNITIHNL